VNPTASDFSDVVLPELPEVPGMTSMAECRHLYRLASVRFAGHVPHSGILALLSRAESP
jgi:hypothetical protein